ncbi:CHAD domain-containing protein [Silvibacterium bohemicum]|uniref:CHAD domain-containing protein n=1 Tax=Silvibacterium bohemicum TaxID=1577686 RepID=A0A841K0M5_9BACT|nr:CHAD domain-containing protein [Silvibacterium bohemicum]MBB6143794.1 CHAD domain-containing protein [Silvibacterium bohemicum]
MSKPRPLLVSSPTIIRFPMNTFPDRVAALNGAISTCTAKPTVVAVQGLRKAVRQVEAQLTLLDLIRDRLPHRAAQSREAWLLLKKVRGAAGTVRDLDVQGDLIHKDTSIKSNARLGSQNDNKRGETKHLHRQLAKRREAKALRLVRVLAQNGHSLAVALQSLQQALEEVKEPIISVTELASRIGNWFGANTIHLPQRIAARRTHAELESRAGRERAISLLEMHELHNLRKTAKLCRYLVQVLPISSKTTQKLIKQLRAIQKTGGKWHDWFLLAEIATRHEGKKSSLTERYVQLRDNARINYIQKLASFSWVDPAKA